MTKADARQFISDRLNEPSTKRGIALFITAIGALFGYSLDMTPEKIASLIAVGQLISGVIGMLTADAVKK